ncbi:MAG: ribonuclease E [Planctomycetota bacterium]
MLTASVDPEEWDSSSSPATAENVDEHSDDDDEDSEDDGKRGRAPSKRKQAKTVRGKGKKPGKDSARSPSRRRARLPINDLLKVGDQVVVQVTKDAIGDKGPTLTTYISIPGRYLVLMPSMARTGVSRKIPDDKERRRLKRILTSLKSPTEMGVIVRTAGVGKTKTDLQRDLNYLLGVWETFDNRLKTGRGPAPLYQESDVAIRTLRDLFNKTTKQVLVDDPGVLEQLDAFAEGLMPEHRDRIEAYKGDRPIFHEAGIEQDFEKIFTRRVELASGGSVVFDQAEALVAIDVNSGRTRTDSFDFEEIALKTNLEAVPEIALQIRLRDLGGIIVCDFIDMMKSSSNRAVERALRTEMSPDRARSKLGRISQFGLLELTRQRLGPGTHKKVFQACPRCRGTALIRTVESRAQAILRRLGSALTQKGFSQVEVRAHPEVIVYLKERLWDYMRALEHRFERELKLTSVPDQPEDSVLRYLRADGREVRPGGRRKR